jgi:hypothetical protein
MASSTQTDRRQTPEEDPGASSGQPPVASAQRTHGLEGRQSATDCRSPATTDATAREFFRLGSAPDDARVVQAGDRVALAVDAADRGGGGGSRQKVALLGAGECAFFPTWGLWGTTYIEIKNHSSVGGPATLEVYAGNVATFDLMPDGHTGSAVTIKGEWVGRLLWVKNSSSDLNSRLLVVVW